MIAGAIDNRLAEPELKPIADTEPEVTARLKALLVSGSLGKLSAKDFKHMPAAIVAHRRIYNATQAAGCAATPRPPGTTRDG